MRLLFATATALCLSAVLLLTAACNPEAFGGRSNANKTTVTASPVVANSKPTLVPQPAESVRRITVAELKQALDEQKAVVIDVRGEPSYKAGHIKGAQMIPAAEIGRRANELPKDKLIVTYCS